MCTYSYVYYVAVYIIHMWYICTYIDTHVLTHCIFMIDTNCSHTLFSVIVSSWSVLQDLWVVETKGKLRIPALVAGNLLPLSSQVFRLPPFVVPSYILFIKSRSACPAIGAVVVLLLRAAIVLVAICCVHSSRGPSLEASSLGLDSEATWNQQVLSSRRACTMWVAHTNLAVFAFAL